MLDRDDVLVDAKYHDRVQEANRILAIKNRREYENRWFKDDSPRIILP